MKTTAAQTTASHAAASEINRLYAEVQRLTVASHESLHGALAAAWQAGQLLLAEKKRVLRRMGGGAWLLWLEQNFQGAPRTAQKYMKLARSVDNVAFLRGLSLRQAYLRLGIATEPKERTGSAHVSKLPAHVRFAGKLVVALRSDQQHGRISPEQAEAYRRDLRPLYGLLRPLFENSPANLSTSSLTNKLEP
ncbi:DUF3102 domain-containing protein [Termitidicoccus mucosus]|uniref:DUF3102 domain-containing protein n=1 Tax=Termitidicoccus mucosus TaxID=1184151 RepID=A0A178IKA8_9BACT|nr:hypothetical protein AW736_11935 [Opitutaceae bacterium TSB47]